MIGPKEIERYQRMTPEEKLREFADLMDVALAVLADLPPEERKRRWEAMDREEEEAAHALARRLAQAAP